MVPAPHLLILMIHPTHDPGVHEEQHHPLQKLDLCHESLPIFLAHFVLLFVVRVELADGLRGRVPRQEVVRELGFFRRRRVVVVVDAEEGICAGCFGNRDGRGEEIVLL